jgi:hypothetical protein
MANFDLSKLMEGKNPQSVMLAETRQLKSKWENTGLLEGLGEKEQGAMSVLLENQAKQLLDEASQTGVQNNSEEWSGVALPLVRRIFGEIASKEFVSVQPMNLPSGLVFYLDFKYGTAQGGNPAFNGQSLFGGDGSDVGSTNVAENGLYGDGRFGYSANDVTASIAVGDITFASASWADVGFDASLSQSISDGEIAKLTFAAPATADLDGANSFNISDDEIVTTINQFNGADGSNLVMFVSASAGYGTAAADFAVLTYSVVPADYARGDFEDGKNAGQVAGAAGAVGTSIDIPEVDLELKSEAIVAKTRKLKAVWTPELAQDLNAYHSIDAEAELTSMLSDYISLEIDLEILDMLKSNALTTEYWSATIGEEYNSSTGAWSAGTSGVAYQKNTWFQTLGTKLNKVSNKIHQLTLRGGANFVVASPDVCTILESIPGFTVSADKDAMSFAAGVTSVGAIANRYTVYKNPYMTSNEILLGFRGSNFLETGAVYAPYVPLIMTPLVYDPTNFTPRRGVMTRYAKKMVRPEYYGKIYVKDLASI